MQKRYALLFPFFVIFILSMMSQAHAEPEVDITYIPQQLADHLGIPILASEILMSAGVLFSVILPLAVLKVKGIYVILLAFPVIAFLVGFQWLPVWLIVIMALFVALMYGKNITKMM